MVSRGYSVDLLSQKGLQVGLGGLESSMLLQAKGQGQRSKALGLGCRIFR